MDRIQNLVDFVGEETSTNPVGLVQLNRPDPPAQSQASPPADTQALILQRLDEIERNMQFLHRDLEQVMHILAEFAAAQSTRSID